MTIADEFVVDQREYSRRSLQRNREELRKPLISQRTGPWTAAEDEIALRDDLYIIEKVAMLQRSSTAINARIQHLRWAPVANCPVCGSEFLMRRNAKNLTCSNLCAGELFRTRPDISCDRCGVTFKRHKIGRRFCSMECAVPPRVGKTCQNCAVVYYTKKPKPEQRFCSLKCSAAYRRPSHCKRGHEFTAKNTHVDQRGYRQCRACDRIRCAAKRHSRLRNGFKNQPGTGAQVRRTDI